MAAGAVSDIYSSLQKLAFVCFVLVCCLKSSQVFSLKISTNKLDQYHVGTNTNHCYLSQKCTGIRNTFPTTHSCIMVNDSPHSKLSLRRKILSLMQSLFLGSTVCLCLCLCIRLQLLIHLSKERVLCGILQVNALENLLLFVITSDIFSTSLGQTIFAVVNTDSGRLLKRPVATVWQEIFDILVWVRIHRALAAQGFSIIQ